MVIILLSAKNMPKMFWAKATAWSFHVLNRSTTKALSKVTPQEAWSGVKPTVNHFCIWGCLAHVHIPKEKRTKLDSRSCICVLTDMSEESKAYRLINPETMKVIISKDVVFEEHRGWDWSQRKEVQVEEEELSWGNYDFVDDDYILIDDNGVEVQDLDEQPIRANVIKCDNTSAIQLSRTAVFHGRCKHIGVRFHFLRDLVGKGIINLEYVDTREQVADILTKPLHRDNFVRLRERLGVCSLKDKHDSESGHV